MSRRTSALSSSITGRTLAVAALVLPFVVGSAASEAADAVDFEKDLLLVPHGGVLA